MKSFNECVLEYKSQIKKGDIVTAYRGLMNYMLSLRSQFRNRCPEYGEPGNLYYGYMDMTYFALVPENLKKKGLKIAIVLIHDKMRFEAWLAAYNKKIQLKYWDAIKRGNPGKYHIPSSLAGKDSIAEFVLTDESDFSDTEKLTLHIISQTRIFIDDMTNLISKITI